MCREVRGIRSRTHEMCREVRGIRSRTGLLFRMIYGSEPFLLENRPPAEYIIVCESF